MNVFGSGILDVLIGLVLVYVLLGLLCSMTNELIVARIFNTRSSSLKDGVTLLLDGPSGATTWTDKFYRHALVQGLSKAPSYIPADIFSRVVADIGLSSTDGQVAVHGAAGEHLRDALEALGLGASDLASYRKNIETWFNANMDRLSGAYKRKAQLWTLGISVVIVAVLNVDTLNVVDSLDHDSALRDRVVQQATVAAGSGSATAGGETLDQVQGQLDKLGLPIGGWTLPQDNPRDGAISDPLAVPNDFGGWLYKIAGLALSALAGAAGAQFWFDTLRNLVNMRGTGPAPAPPPAASG